MSPEEFPTSFTLRQRINAIVDCIKEAIIANDRQKYLHYMDILRGAALVLEYCVHIENVSRAELVYIYTELETQWSVCNE